MSLSGLGCRSRAASFVWNRVLLPIPRLDADAFLASRRATQNVLPVRALLPVGDVQGRALPLKSVPRQRSSRSKLIRAAVRESVGGKVSPAQVEPMEVEVKLRLPSAEAHARVEALLKANLQAVYFQENIFFDGANQELSKNKVVLRIRFYNNNEKCVVTVKGKAVLLNGISRSSEEEEDVAPELGRAYVDDPGLLSTSEVALIRSVRSSLACSHFTCLGGFKNIRKVFSWEGLTIELDETQFPFGTQYEIECEHTEPERIKAQLEAFLSAHGVPFLDSQRSKFSTFKAGALPPLDAPATA